jgi:hypothetical protein
MMRSKVAVRSCPHRLEFLFALLPVVASGGCAETQASVDVAGSTSPTTAAAAPSAAVTGPPAAASAGPTLSTVLTTDPGQLQQIFTAAASASNASLAPGGSVGDPIESGVRGVASKAAPGMQPVAPIAKGTLQEKGHSEMMVTLEVGKCYSIVGYSPEGGVADLDLHLLAPPLYNILTGEDTTDDNMPVVAKAPNSICPAVAVPLPYKVDIFADRGSGAFGVELYSKAK